MAGVKSIYVCLKCDAQFPKWSGRCLECGEWGSLQNKVVDEQNKPEKNIENFVPAEVINLDKIKEQNLDRVITNIGEVDRVLGGGIVCGSLILLGGEPGIGKSTIVAQIANSAIDSGVIYVSGEESASQIKSRLQRLKCCYSKIKFISETNVEKIIASLKKEKCKLVIIDSIQTVYNPVVLSGAGSINQIRASATRFLEVAKSNDITFILIGHITKDGQIAGPKTLEHIVDTVIYLETESTNNYRILRTTKNRFGSINELGIFEMTGEGFKEIVNPGSIFVELNKEKISGSAISCIIEGTRPFLVEIQALVTKTMFGFPQRKSSGFDLNRLQLLTAVLTKRAKINLTNKDVILNVVGGLKINDPALDLAVCFAIASSFFNYVINKQTIILGEIGLGGEIRRVAKLEQRLSEVKKLGFNRAVIPDFEVNAKNIKLEKIKNLTEIIKHIVYD